MFLKIIREKAFITATEDNQILLLKLDDILFCATNWIKSSLEQIKPLLSQGSLKFKIDNANKILQFLTIYKIKFNFRFFFCFDINR